MTGVRSVVVERAFAVPPEKLWRALTQPHLIAEWLMPNDFRPNAGHRSTLRNTPRPDVDLVIDCEVIAIEPQRTLSYSWSAYGLDSIVTFTLTPTPGGTMLRMEQAGFRADQRQAFAGAKAGWRMFLDVLDQLLAGTDFDAGYSPLFTERTRPS